MKRIYSWFVTGFLTLVLLAMLALIGMITGCKTLKHTSKVVVTVHDTVDLVRVDSFTRELVVRDTVIGVSGNEIVTAVHDTVIVKGGTRLVIRDNKVHCSTDSLTLVIQNLRSELVRNALNSDSRKVTKEQTLSSVADVERGGYWANAKWYLIVFICGALAGFVIKWKVC